MKKNIQEIKIVINIENYSKIHKIYSFNDLKEFILVDVLKEDYRYSRIFVLIPKINQIQCVASNESKKIWHLWEIEGYRTTFDRLESQWTCPIRKKILTKDEVISIFPGIKEIQIVVGQKRSSKI